jgi:hypothetical protein
MSHEVSQIVHEQMNKARWGQGEKRQASEGLMPWGSLESGKEAGKVDVMGTVRESDFDIFQFIG